MSERITTVYLGLYAHHEANDIAGHLEQAGIVWWYKQPSIISQIWEFGTRLFVDRAKLDEAKEIARKVLAGELDPPPPPAEATDDPSA